VRRSGRTAAPAPGPCRPAAPAAACCGLLRPDVVWFGESLAPDLVHRSIRAVEACDLLLVIGTSSLVQPAASFADTALARGIPVVEINSDRTPLSDRATQVLRGRSGDLLPRLISGEPGARNR
jgi:NAD-dependent deacetylase